MVAPKQPIGDFDVTAPRHPIGCCDRAAAETMGPWSTGALRVERPEILHARGVPTHDRRQRQNKRDAA